MINPYFNCGPCPFECGLKRLDGTERCAMNRCMRDCNNDDLIVIKDKKAKIYLGDHPIRTSTVKF